MPLTGAAFPIVLTCSKSSWQRQKTACTFPLPNSTGEPNISFGWLQNKKICLCQLCGRSKLPEFAFANLSESCSRAVVSLTADAAQLQPHQRLRPRASPPPAEAAACPCGHHLFGRNPRSAHLRRGSFPSSAHPSLRSARRSLPRPGRACNFPRSLALAPLGWPSRDAASLSAPAPELSAEGPSALNPRPPAGRAGKRAHARPPPPPAPLPAGGAAPPAAPPLAGREPEGAPGAAPQTCSGCSPRRSLPTAAAVAAAPAAPPWEPRGRARLSSAPGTPNLFLARSRAFAARHGFPPGAGARLLALPTGGRRVRREVGWAPRPPLLLLLAPGSLCGAGVLSPRRVARPERSLRGQKLGHRAASAGGEPSNRSRDRWPPEAGEGAPCESRSPAAAPASGVRT